jgi:hypothetical protein
VFVTDQTRQSTGKSDGSPRFRHYTLSSKTSARLAYAFDVHVRPASCVALTRAPFLLGRALTGTGGDCSELQRCAIIVQHFLAYEKAYKTMLCLHQYLLRRNDNKSTFQAGNTSGLRFVSGLPNLMRVILGERLKRQASSIYWMYQTSLYGYSQLR